MLNPLLLSNINLGNLSGFITFLVIFIHSDYYYYRNMAQKLCSQILNFLGEPGNQLEFTCTETYRNFFGGCSANSMNSSDTFKAICLHIKKKINEGKTVNLCKLKELTHKLYSDESNDLKEILYIASQNEKFYLIDEFDKDIYFQIKKSNLEINSGQKDPITGNNYTLIVSSNKKSLQFLQSYVDNILKEYYKVIEYQLLEKEYVFIFEGSDNEGNLNFSSYPFTTTSNFDNFYHHEKEKIINQINFFRDNKDWYQKRGKPYTLGICTWGTPGCGKTTFEKIITSYLKRHLIIVDFSRIKNQREADLIFFSEKINNIIIPYEKRIYCFPDVDRMTEIIQKDVNTNKNDQSSLSNQKKDILSSILSDKMEDTDNILKCPKNKSESPLNLSKILNILDGIPERTGQIVMMSCNHPEKLDKAFLRPGRIDILTEFKKMNFKDLQELVSNYYNISKESLETAALKKSDNKWSPAEVFKICSQNKNIQQCLQELSTQNPQEFIFPF